MALFKRKAKSTEDSGEKRGQIKVLKDAFKLVRKHKPTAFLWMSLSFVVVLSAGIIVGTLLDHPIYFTMIALPMAILATFLSSPDRQILQHFYQFRIK